MMKLSVKWGRKSGLLIGTLLVTVAVSACSPIGGKKDKAGLNTLEREDSGTLKVAYFNEQSFYMQYGNAFQAMFPNVALEVVSTESVFGAEDPAAEMEKLVDEQQPDVMYLTEEQYSVLAGKGKLYDLDAVVKQDEFDLSGYHPAVIDLLKARGGGKLYGLSPNFGSQALYYNKDLFDKNGIPYPTDGMSWEEVLQLASRFPAKKDGDDVMNGLFQSSQTANSFELIRSIGEAKGLQYADTDAKTLTIQTPEWKSIFQMVIDGYKTGSISMPADGGKGGGMMMRGMGGASTFSIGPDSMRFMSGQAAMTIDGPMIMNFLGMNVSGAGMTRAAAVSKDGKAMESPFKDINWDVVSVPVDPSQPDVSGGMSLESVFSINASSKSLSAAWEFIKYANGEQLAKTNAMSSPSLSARTAFKKQLDGKNIDAFYALGANQQSLLQVLPEGFANSFAQLASGEIKNVVEGSQSLDDALGKLQSQGQQLLTKSIMDAGQE